MEMNDSHEVNWEIDPEDVGCDEYECYHIVSINFHAEEKVIWSVTYTYIWDCGDGCCSQTERDSAYVGGLSHWIKKRILKEMPGYSFERA